MCVRERSNKLNVSGVFYETANGNKEIAVLVVNPEGATGANAINEQENA